MTKIAYRSTLSRRLNFRKFPEKHLMAPFFYACNFSKLERQGRYFFIFLKQNCLKEIFGKQCQETCFEDNRNLCLHWLWSYDYGLNRNLCLH